MYRYAQVETVLLHLSGLHESYRTGLRARIKYFQRLGVLADAPGKGSRIEYEFTDVAHLAFCFELAQFDIDPTRIALILRWLWPPVSKIVALDPIREDAILLAYPAFLNRKAVEDSAESRPTGQGLFQIDFDGPDQRLVFAAVEASSIKRPRRVLEIDLGALRRAIVAALAEVAGDKASS